MSAVVIVGAQWGDEGKGKVVDLATEKAEVVVRYAGGPNAGHTLVVGEDKVVVRLVPSGILQPHAVCIMAQGMVIDCDVLLGEIDALEARGISTRGRLVLSDRAHVILPFHLEIDALREAHAGGAKLGTTKKGIGPAYEDKAARRGLRLGDLVDPKRTHTIVSACAEAWAPVIEKLGGKLPDVKAVCDHLAEVRPRLQPLFADTSLLVDRALKNKKRILLEGAQGTLLDIDHGTYPYVTSSSAVAGGACTGAGVGPSRISRVVGITKAYATRVGEGPFPTELFDDIGKHLREKGGEFGSVTGRPRRTGWLDIPALRYAARVNGIDGWALTKLDVLTGLKEIAVCVAYQTPNGKSNELPASLEGTKPIFAPFPGWREPLDKARSLAELPQSARMLVKFVEEATEVGVDIVSVGPRRDETIVLRDLFA